MIIKIQVMGMAAIFAASACASKPPSDNSKLKLLSELRYDTQIVSAASGLAHHKIWDYVIADDERSLYAFTYKVCAVDPVCVHKKENVQAYALSEQELPTDPKERSRVKPDYEALLKVSSGAKNYLLVIPSGSKENRGVGARFDLDTKKHRTVDFAPLYSALREKVVGLNIEGVADTGAEIILFQRGNMKGSQSAMIHLNKLQVLSDLENLKLFAKSIMKIVPMDLGKVSGTPLGFSDALSTEKGIYFLATAEASNSSTKNGEIVGTQLGLIDKSGNVQKLAWFSGEKFEGLHVLIYDNRTLVYMVDDPDDRAKAARHVIFEP